MLSPNKPLPPDFTYNFPADLKNVISYTTLKVLEGGNIPTLMTRNVNELEKEEEEAKEGEEEEKEEKQEEEEKEEEEEEEDKEEDEEEEEK